MNKPSLISPALREKSPGRTRHRNKAANEQAVSGGGGSPLATQCRLDIDTMSISSLN